MVVVYQIDKHQELGCVGTGIGGNLIEAKANDRIDPENRVVGIVVPWAQGIWSKVPRSVLAEHFSGAF